MFKEVTLYVSKEIETDHTRVKPTQNLCGPVTFCTLYGEGSRQDALIISNARYALLSTISIMFFYLEFQQTAE